MAEDGRAKAYQTNALNQYTAITEEGAAPFHPTYDANGNQTLIQTATGIWAVDYDFFGQPIKFTRGTTVITCGYDYMGRRWFRKITEDGTVVKHERYLYRGYQQIATVDLMQPQPTVRHVIIWDPSEPTATRPLALLAGGQLYLYGVDFSKNVTELMDSATGTLAATYDYSPFGTVSSSGGLAAVNPLQWSSEVYDPATALVYYNYRYLNTTDGRWISRDRIAENGGLNLYEFVRNNPVYSTDYLGNGLWDTIFDAGKWASKKVITGKFKPGVDDMFPQLPVPTAKPEWRLAGEKKLKKCFICPKKNTEPRDPNSRRAPASPERRNVYRVAMNADGPDPQPPKAGLEDNGYDFECQWNFIIGGELDTTLGLTVIESVTKNASCSDSCALTKPTHTPIQIGEDS